MVIRRTAEWLFVLAAMVLITLIPLYNGYRAYTRVEQFIHDLPTLLADYLAESDSRGNSEGRPLADQDVADASRAVASPFPDGARLYDVRSADGGSLLSPLFAQSLHICRVTDESPVAPPTTDDVASLSLYRESLRRFQWLGTSATYLETLLEAFSSSLDFDLTASPGPRNDQQGW
jgi:hypothetical protein